jgi:hypothetical protein
VGIAHPDGTVGTRGHRLQHGQSLYFGGQRPATLRNRPVIPVIVRQETAVLTRHIMGQCNTRAQQRAAFLGSLSGHSAPGSS